MGKVRVDFICRGGFVGVGKGENKKRELKCLEITKFALVGKSY